MNVDEMTDILLRALSESKVNPDSVVFSGIGINKNSQNYISLRRKQLKLSLADVAKQVGVSRTTIMRWENGSIDSMPIKHLNALATVLQTTPERILGIDDSLNEYGAQFLYFNQKSFKISDNAMMPRFFNGDVVIFREQRNVKNGQVAVVKIADNAPIVRVIHKNKDGIMLMTMQGLAAPVYYTKEQCNKLPVTVMGVPVAVFGKV